MSTILALGFRADTAKLVKELEAIVARHGLNASVVGNWSKYYTKLFLDKRGRPISGTAFEVDTDNNWSSEDANRPWPQYESDEVGLFVCSTITREDNDEYAEAKYDGEMFAKMLMPRTPKLILHFKNEFRGDARIDPSVIKPDFESGVYHLPRIEMAKILPGSVDAMDSLVGKLFKQDMRISYETYMSILQSALPK